LLVVAALASFLLELAAVTTIVGNSRVRLVCRDKVEISCLTHLSARHLTALPLGHILASRLFVFE